MNSKQPLLDVLVNHLDQSFLKLREARAKDYSNVHLALNTLNTLLLLLQHSELPVEIALQIATKYKDLPQQLDSMGLARDSNVAYTAIEDLGKRDTG